MVKGFGKILVLALLGFCFAPQTQASLSGDINAVISRKSQKNAHFAVKIVNASTGKTVYAKNSNELMTPASNMKIITSAAALHYLGDEYQFTTVVGLYGKSLIVIGGGDPLLGDPEIDRKHGRKPGWIFTDIEEALKKNRVKSLKEIVIDSTFFDRNRTCPNWDPDDLSKDYACEVSGLNYNLNCIKVSVKRSKSKPIIMIEPQTRYFAFENKLKSVSKGSTVIGVHHNTVPNKLLVTGNCAPGKGASATVAIKRPSALFGVLLAEHLARAGIGIPDKILHKYAKNNKRIKVLKVYRTPIAQVLPRCNKDSLNLTAEAFVKTISAENTTGRINGEWRHGHVLVGRYLNGLGIADTEFTLDDGSGLSPKNKVTANALGKVLLSMYKGDKWKLYKASLAVGGVDGTLDKRFTEARYKGKIIGKSGYISRVRTLSGVATTPRGDYIFSILTRGGAPSTRQAVNDIAQAIIDNIK